MEAKQAPESINVTLDDDNKYQWEEGYKHGLLNIRDGRNLEEFGLGCCDLFWREGFKAAYKDNGGQVFPKAWRQSEHYA